MNTHSEILGNSSQANDHSEPAEGSPQEPDHSVASSARHGEGMSNGFLTNGAEDSAAPASPPEAPLPASLRASSDILPRSQIPRPEFQPPGMLTHLPDGTPVGSAFPGGWYDPRDRIPELRAKLESGEIPDDQRINVLALLDDLENDRPVSEFYQEGHRVNMTNIDHTKPFWEGTEVAFEFFEAAVMSGILLPGSHYPSTQFLIVEMRVHPALQHLNVGPPPPSMWFNLLFDTGSDYTTVFHTDPIATHVSLAYLTHYQPRRVLSADGVLTRYNRIMVQCRLWSQDGTRSIGPWFDEYALVKPFSDRVPRLTGKMIRGALYFATDKNWHLVASNNKTGIVQNLPA
ncbi:hypothetical protein Dda_1907 [Drechslerella dactyloides]|uniref:Uncharacterized protein n=1 Tax=Drechslerella dactyloides TaxID=74499 RepID=A0AAD6J4E4_DREDA|nr:hypothetical protein Dda_1907 [Drechslerella dactyloides]